MRRLALSASVFCAPLVLAACADPSARGPAAAGAPSQAEAPPGVAVVELFTSEGCSSCPPADAVLARLADEAAPGVLPLAFHVDYWDRLGWRDPYGSPAHSERQRAVAASLDGRVYTPEIVVNGTVGVVGSREGQVRDAIRAALQTAPSAAVELAATVRGREVRVAPRVTGAPEGARLHVALVQRAAEQEVTRGENTGRTLRHANVVRAFETVDPAAPSVALALPDGLAPAGAFVVAYVQAARTGPVLGAGSAPLADGA